MDQPDTESLKNAFKLVFPEETLVLFSPHKQEWITEINRAIAALQVMDESGIPRIRSGP